MRSEEKREYDRRYYAARSPEKKLRKQQLQAERTLRNLRTIRNYKQEKGCMDCSENDPVVLEFDHRDPATKLFAIGDARRLGWSLDKLMREIEKCDVVCANCHRRRTYKQLNWNG